MGSARSGRRDGKPLVEDCLTLDLARLMRLGPIRDGMAGQGVLDWSIDGQAIGMVHFRLDLREATATRLVLSYAIADGAGKSRSVSQSLRLAFTAPHFGGRRWWLICPVTGERVRCLHLPAGGDCFASRKALGLGYRVERLGHFDRPFEKLFRLQRKLGGASGWGIGPRRRRGMWQRTFDRHLAAHGALDAVCGVAVLRRMGALTVPLM